MLEVVLIGKSIIKAIGEFRRGFVQVGGGRTQRDIRNSVNMRHGFGTWEGLAVMV